MQTKGKYINWQEQDHLKDPRYRFYDSVASQTALWRVERWGDVGYFRVPGGGAKSVHKVIKLITDSLCTITPSTVKGWILDLRLNGGGNVWFNLGALASLIGDGCAGGISYLDERDSEPLLIEKGRVAGNGQLYGADSAKCPLFSASTPVVVIAGPLTGSSAETLLLAFKGRPNTLILGEPTGGYTTNNNSFPITADVVLVLATGYMMDRAGNRYKGPIKPDMEVIGGDNFLDLHNDAKIAAAMQWLKKSEQ